MLWAALPSGEPHVPWLLFGVPLLPMVLALVCRMAQRPPTDDEAFEDLWAQLRADGAMLRQASPP